MNAEDLLTGPRTFTIKEVRGSGSSEQPVEVVFEEFPAGRPFKPSKTVMRIMVAAWDKETDAYVGKRMTLYRDPTVRFGGQDVGGIRVSHMSGIKSRLTVSATVSKGKRALYTVEPLTEPAPQPKSLKQQVWERSQQIEPDLSDDERKNWIKGELADLGGDTPENLTKLLSNWESK